MTSLCDDPSYDKILLRQFGMTSLCVDPLYDRYDIAVGLLLLLICDVCSAIFHVAMMPEVDAWLIVVDAGLLPPRAAQCVEAMCQTGPLKGSIICRITGPRVRVHRQARLEFLCRGKMAI